MVQTSSFVTFQPIILIYRKIPTNRLSIYVIQKTKRIYITIRKYLTKYGVGETIIALVKSGIKVIVFKFMSL